LPIARWADARGWRTSDRSPTRLFAVRRRARAHGRGPAGVSVVGREGADVGRGTGVIGEAGG